MFKIAPYFPYKILTIKMNNTNLITIFTGSDSDLPTIEPMLKILKKFNISFDLKIASAHRTPQYVKQCIEYAEKNGTKVFIAVAGLAAHLAGVVAAHTIKPVIGVPINAALGGLDSLLSTVQMPGGIPVATVAIGSAGAKNAAYLAMQILATYDTNIAEILTKDRANMTETVIAKNKNL